MRFLFLKGKKQNKTRLLFQYRRIVLKWLLNTLLMFLTKPIGLLILTIRTTHEYYGIHSRRPSLHLSLLYSYFTVPLLIVMIMKQTYLRMLTNTKEEIRVPWTDIARNITDNPSQTTSVEMGKWVSLWSKRLDQLNFFVITNIKCVAS